MENWLEVDGHPLRSQIVLVELMPFVALCLAGTGLTRGHRGGTGGQSLSLAVASLQTLWGPLQSLLLDVKEYFSPTVAKSAALIGPEIAGPF